MSSDSENSDNNSSSTSDELMEIVNMLPRPKIYRHRKNVIEDFDDIDFKMRFRFSKTAVQEMVHIFHLNNFHHNTNRNLPVTPIMQLLITLRFFATGCFQQVLGDHVNIHKSTVSRIITRITAQIASHARDYIKMPRRREAMLESMSNFYRVCGFPRIVGCIDCTHIKILSPGGENAEIYRNRKGWFSINVQAVCDTQLQIRDIVARWPGSVHDSTIFNSSALRAQFEAGEFLHGWLLGDSGYACKDYLLTPVLNPATQAEERYNISHIQTRNLIERTFGVWKRRFPCLSMGLRMKPEKAVNIIVAAAVLHNLAINLNDTVPTGHDVIEEAINVDVEDNNIPARTALINQIFIE